MFTNILTLAGCERTTNTLIWLLNAPPIVNPYEMTQIAKCMVFSVDVPFFRVSACRENTYSLKIKKIAGFSITLFALRNSQQSYYTCCHATRSLKVHRRQNPMLLLPVVGLQHNNANKYKLHLSCSWQWWNLSYVNTIVVP